MSKVRLVIEELKILRPKKRWRLYFVVATEDPTDDTKMLVTSTPNPYIKMKPAMDNVLDFEPTGEDADGGGFFVLERDMPADKSINVQMYLRHSRAFFSDAGDVLKEIEKQLGEQSYGIVGDVLGAGNTTWLSIAKKAAPMLGGILQNITDRDMGFVSMFESFGPEFEKQTELDRSNKFSTGEASIVWSWSTVD